MAAAVMAASIKVFQGITLPYLTLNPHVRCAIQSDADSSSAAASIFWGRQDHALFHLYQLGVQPEMLTNFAKQVEAGVQRAGVGLGKVEVINGLVKAGEGIGVNT
jgi:hypothetical protein